MTTAAERVKIIEDRLKQALNPSILTVRDDSRHHADHLSAKASGGGHYSVTVVSEAFEGKSLVARHQMIYQALEGWVGKEIHAIQMTAKTKSEYEKENAGKMRRTTLGETQTKSSGDAQK